MKKITMMYLKNCPYCKKAQAWMEELFEEHPAYRNIELERIEESEQPEIADSLDYWYVPSYFVDGIKVHEGVATKEKIQDVFEKAMK